MTQKSLDIPTAEVFLPLLQPARYKGAYGGRGSGKSHFFAELLVEESIRRKVDAVCLREVQKSLEYSAKRTIEGKISSLNAGGYFEVQDRRILSKLGGVIIFEGLQNHTADSIKSLEGFDIGWVEEAQSISQTSLDVLRPTIRKPGSELWFSWNPQNQSDPVDKFLRDNPPTDSIVVEANYKDNPWLPAELLAEMEHDLRTRGQDKFAHIWLGAYKTASDAQVFKNWRVEEFDAPTDAIFRFGADWGFAVDPSVLIRCYTIGRKLYIDYEAYKIGCEIVNLPDLFLSIPESEKWPIVADSARPETISHMQKHGFPRIVAAVKGPKSIEEGVEWLQSYEIIVHPRCKHTIDELSLYAYEIDKQTGEVLPVLADKNNHVIDALRYACEAWRRTVKKRPQIILQDQGPRSWQGA